MKTDGHRKVILKEVRSKEDNQITGDEVREKREKEEENEVKKDGENGNRGRGGNGQEIGIGDTEEIGKTVCVERPRVCKNPADPTSPAKIGYRPVNVIAVQQG